ncbi:MAG: hypothetical protein II260_06335 [Muribaculaceae bacterium]|nr:hypothetical protein [Muribaculaceae bacterium]
MLLDIGAMIFLAGLILVIRATIKDADSGQKALCVVMMAIGGILMIVEHYIIQGNSSFITNAIM